MGKLVFRVASDWQEVVRLRTEIEKLKQTLLSMDSNQSPDTFKKLNAQLGESSKKMNILITEAAKAGAVMEGDFKKKIFDASQTVNVLSEKMTLQRGTIQQLKNELSGLKDKYREALKQDGDTSSLEAKIKSTSAKLREQKDTLFNLTQEQANARLSVKKLRDEYALYENDGKQVVETNQNIGLSLGKALGVIGGAAALKKLGSEIIRVRGEFQSMQTAIETMVGKDMAGQLIPQIKELAKISPLTMSDMVGAEKMMLGFNIQAEDTIKYLKAISDISMGESGKFNSLTLAFSQMSAAGKLMGQDLNQMINAGFNPLQVIAEKTGKSIAALKEEMSKGAVSAEMVQQAFIDATSAGGKFFGMSENASKTINGQISMMQDALDNALNEIGKSSEGFIMSGIQATTSLIQNYETVGKVLVGLIATYGTYRTAVITNIALTRGWAVAARADGVAKGMQTIATKAQTVAQLALNSAMKANLYVLTATLIVGVASAMWALHDSTTAAEKGVERYNEEQGKAARLEAERKQKIDGLVQSSRDIALSDLQRGQSLAELRKEYPKIFAQYDIETIKLADILKLKQQIAEEDAKRVGERVARDFEAANKAVSDYETTLTAKQINGGKLTQQEINKLKELRSVRDQFLVDRGSPISEQFISNLKNIDISELDNYISELEKQIKGKGEDGKIKLRLPIDMKGSLSDEAIYDIKDIKTLIDTAKTAKKTAEEAAKAEKKTGKEWLDYYKGKYEEADKAYNDFLKSKTAMSDADRDKELKRLKGLRDTAKKTYESKGGVVSSSSKQESEVEKQRKKQQKSAEELLSLRRQNQQDEINLMKDGSDKKLKQIELNYQKELDAIKKQERAWSKEQGGKLTQEQSVEISTRYANAESKKDKNISDVQEEQIKEYKDLLSQYQDYIDKRLAIEKSFNDDIAILQEARKKAIEKGDSDEVAKIDRTIGKRTEVNDEDLFKLNVEQFKQDMDWEQVFGNLDKVSSDTLKKLKSNLKDFISTQKDLSPENLKELVDAVERIDEKLSEHNPFESMSVSFKSLKSATDAQREAQEAYNKALKEGTDEEKKNAGATLESAKNNKRKALVEATTALQKGVDEIGQYVDAGNQVIGIMETLGVKTPEWLGGYMEGVGEMLNGLSNIDLTKPMSIVTGSLQTTKGALTSVISLGGLIPGLNGADYSGYENMKSQYENLISIWDELIDKKMQYIDIDYGKEAMKAAKEAEDATNIQINRQRQLIKQLASSGAGKGSHSLGYRIDHRLSKEDYQRLSDLAGQKITAEYQLWDLSPEQIEKILSDEKLVSVLDTVNKDFVTYLQNIVDYGDKLDEITEKTKEAVTGISFDEFRSGYAGLLSDLDSTNEDFADNFEKYLQQAIFESLLANEYKDQIKKLYDTWAEYGKDGLNSDEAQMLRNMQQELTNDLLAKRDELMNDFGWESESDSSTSQSATSKGFQSMSQDTGEELNGRFTALQTAGEEVKNQSVIQSQSLNLLTARADTILSVNTETRNIADETRTILANSYLELVQISENTGNSAKYLKDIKADIAEVKKNTSKL